MENNESLEWGPPSDYSEQEYLNYSYSNLLAVLGGNTQPLEDGPNQSMSAILISSEIKENSRIPETQSEHGHS